METTKICNKEIFILELKRYREKIPKHTLKTLRGQALSGDVKGARKGLEKVLNPNLGLVDHRR